jgi:serine/threonine-protein kinase
MEDLRNELRQVLQEIDAGAAAYQGVAPEPPRHLAGGNPVSRAVRWLKSITRSESPTTSPNLVTPSKQGIHETPFTTVADHEKKSLAILCFRNLSNDPAASFYEFSLADAVITELARVRSLVVRPSASVPF